MNIKTALEDKLKKLTADQKMVDIQIGDLKVKVSAYNKEIIDIERLIEYINEIVADDEIGLIRCADCKHYSATSESSGNCWLVNNVRFPNGYCSYAKMRIS
jgi:hypothetical protein